MAELPPPNVLRCHRNDGKHWRCKNAKREGYEYCDKHISRRRLPQKGIEERGSGISSPGKPETMVDHLPPDALRCNRKGGKGWHCHKVKMEGHPFCDYHCKYRRPKGSGEGSSRRRRGHGRRPLVRSGGVMVGAVAKEDEDDEPKKKDAVYVEKGKIRIVERDSDAEYCEELDAKVDGGQLKERMLRPQETTYTDQPSSDDEHITLKQMYTVIYDAVKKQRRELYY